MRREQPDPAVGSIDWAAVEQEAATLLSRYLQFDTTNPPGNEAAALEFLADILYQRGFTPQLLQSAPGRTNLIACLPAGVKAAQPACLLYSHADVVPANPAEWSIPPFAGWIQDGFVYGRGALDAKGLGIIFLQALTLLKQSGPSLNRPIILLIAADEELSGRYGVAWLLEHHSALLEAEYVWDEGGVALAQAAAPKEYLYQIALAEKSSLIVKLVAHGTPGHAAIPHPDNPQDRLVQALMRLKWWNQPARLTRPVIQMLQTQASRQPWPRSILYAHADKLWLWPLLRGLLERDPLFVPLLRTTVSLTMLRGGETSNVIPAQAEAKLDIRLLPGENPELVLTALRSVIADPKVVIEVEEWPVVHLPSPAATDFYRALAQTLLAIGPPGLVTPCLSPGTTDSRFFRCAGMKAYGFTPMLLDAAELSRIHGLDERVSTANLRWGTQVVYETLCRLAGVVSVQAIPNSGRFDRRPPTADR